ncbi:MAG: rubrerythrin [bacterium]|nr:rubrerythrin family protein [bacterium]MBU1918373.1 rubrerythrin family protein [bacterium]
MTKEFKGTETEKNLMAAFAGESQARNKYTYYAKQARKEGYHYIADFFEETAINEMQHAKDEFKLFHGVGDTKTNLQDAMEGEDYETQTMYPEFAAKAEEEGFTEVARLFKQIAKVEAHHRERYKKLLDMVTNDNVYQRETTVRWTCSKCGFVHDGKTPPGKCPCCKHPKEYFQPNDI